jgi:hypothetical protein
MHQRLDERLQRVACRVPRVAEHPNPPDSEHDGLMV